MAAQITQAFITMAIESQTKYGVPASVTLAQVIVESTGKYPGGLSELAYKYHNLFGIKAYKSWKGKTATYGSNTYRAYDSDAESFDDHGRLLASSTYTSKTKGATTLNEYIDAFGPTYEGPGYPQMLKNAIATYNLTQYDDGSFPTGNISGKATTSITLVFPVEGYSINNISSKYGYRTHPVKGGTQFHKGIDIAAPKDTPILAAAGGTVIASGPASGYGNWIKIDHGNGYVTMYGHMKTLLISKGATVSAGTKIALVGTEGVSTGYHLHFQLEINGDHTDPLPYLKGEKTITSTYSTGYSSSTDEATNPYAPPENVLGTTVGQRVSGLTRQPIFAYINISAGDGNNIVSTSSNPHIIKSFEYNRTINGIGNLSFTVFDESWGEIEKALCTNYDSIYVEYGYTGFAGIYSPLKVQAMLTNYTIDFDMVGTTIHVNASVSQAKNNLRQTSLQLDTYNPTEAVKKICESIGLKVSDENFDESQDVKSDNPFNLVEDFPISYIQNVIVPQSSQEGEEIFYFYISNDNEAHFKRRSFKNSTYTDSLRTYVYQRGYDSNVISLSIDIKGSFAGASTFGIASGLRSSVFGTKDKGESTYEVNNVSVITEAEGESLHQSSDQSTPLVDSAGNTPSQMKSILYYNMKDGGSHAYEAQMTIVGDPTINIYDYVRIINMTDDGYMHHTSGVYWVTKVTDSINEDGTMQTSLVLNRTATKDLDGVEVINPKYLIK